MKMINILLTTLVLSAASAGIAAADGRHGHGYGNDESGMPSGPMFQGKGHGMMQGEGHDMMQMMMQMHAGMMGGGMGMPGMMGGAGMPGMVGPMGPMMTMMDADGDGKITAEEAHGQLQSMHASYDANGDGTLSIDEFETLHSAMIRETMVDRFQHLDANGDGKVTADEMTAPADRIGRLVPMPGTMPGTMMGGSDQEEADN